MIQIWTVSPRSDTDKITLPAHSTVFRRNSRICIGGARRNRPSESPSRRSLLVKLKTGTIARKTQGSIQIYQPLVGDWQLGLGADLDSLPESAKSASGGVFGRLKATAGEAL